MSFSLAPLGDYSAKQIPLMSEQYLFDSYIKVSTFFMANVIARSPFQIIHNPNQHLPIVVAQFSF